MREAAQLWSLSIRSKLETRYPQSFHPQTTIKTAFRIQSILDPRMFSFKFGFPRLSYCDYVIFLLMQVSTYLAETFWRAADNGHCRILWSCECVCPVHLEQ